MYRVTREIDFCYGHRLLNYDGKCKYLHGHNGRAVIAIQSPELDERGMVMDFSEIKRVVNTWIDENLDHRMILHRDDPAVPLLKKLGEPMYLLDVNPTAENIARLIFDFATSQGFNSGDQFWAYLRDSFDVLYAEGATAPKMMSIGLHCRLVGRPGRIAALARFLDHVQRHDRVWLCRRVDIARHWRAIHPPA